jgi:phosphoglycolate phosphatase
MKIGVLFDLDGTLLDTLEDLTDSVNYALGLFGYPERTLEEVRSFIGTGAANLIRKSVPEGADYVPVLAEYQVYYREHCRIKTGPYPGIPQALESVMTKYPVAIVSNKPDGAVKALCADYFPGVYARGESDDCPRKPAPDMLYKAMEAIGVDRCVYVGDSEVDVVTADNAGGACLSVTWGFRNEDVLKEAGAQRICCSTAELPRMIDEIVGEYYNL